MKRDKRRVPYVFRIQVLVQTWRYPDCRQDESRLVAEAVEGRAAPSALPEVGSDGRGLRLQEGIQQPRLRGAEEGSRGADDELAGVVAGRLWALRSVIHPHGVAQ